MIKKILIVFLLISSLNAEDKILAQKQNTLYVQNLIEVEENIAELFEKYILTEFKIPTLEQLRTDNYLGSNFSLKNIMGSDIAYEEITSLKLKYAITKDEFRKNRNNQVDDNYIVQLYNRDLYRNKTNAYDDIADITKSYILIMLQSAEARTIFDLLKVNSTIEKVCAPTLLSTYCNNNQKTIRWYNSNSQWIEYDKKEFNNANITISSASLLSDNKLRDLAVGSYIFIEDKSKYVKLTDDSSGNLQILKVD